MFLDIKRLFNYKEGKILAFSILITLILVIAIIIKVMNTKAFE